MGRVDDNEFYSIGDVARRTGLSVSAIRFYADAGVVVPAGRTGAGYRVYGIRAIMRLELVRTLRELDASLDDIRQLLAEETTLRDLATVHLGLIDRQMRRLRARRAVLRTIVNQDTTIEQVSLMHKLVSMSDDDRDRIIDEFWDEVSDGPISRPRQVYVEELRQARPKLPPEPTTDQLEAWIELADLVQDPDFRRAVRESLQEYPGPFNHESHQEIRKALKEIRESFPGKVPTLADLSKQDPDFHRVLRDFPQEHRDPSEYGREIIQAYRQAVQIFRASFPDGAPTTTPPTRTEWEQRVKKLNAFVREANAAYQAGLATDSPQAQDLADRYVAWRAEMAEVQDHAEMRRRIATDRRTNEKRGRATPLAHGPGPRLSELRTYRTLVAKINGEPQTEDKRAGIEWLMEAICVPGPHSKPTTGN